MSEELFVILFFLAVSDVLMPFILSELVLTLELYIFPEAVPVLLLILSRRTIIRIITASAAMPQIIRRFIGITTILVEEFMCTLPYIKIFISELL